MKLKTDEEIFNEVLEDIKRLAEEVRLSSEIRKNVLDIMDGKTFRTKISALNMMFFDVIMEESDNAVEAAAHVARMAATQMRLIDAAMDSDDDDDDEEDEIIQ
jgi:hypothetical protein